MYCGDMLWSTSTLFLTTHCGLHILWTTCCPQYVSCCPQYVHTVEYMLWVHPCFTDEEGMDTLVLPACGGVGMEELDDIDNDNVVDDVVNNL